VPIAVITTDADAAREHKLNGALSASDMIDSDIALCRWKRGSPTFRPARLAPADAIKPNDLGNGYLRHKIAKC
jgi:hypothetical protein